MEVIPDFISIPTKVAGLRGDMTRCALGDIKNKITNGERNKYMASFRQKSEATKPQALVKVKQKPVKEQEECPVPMETSEIDYLVEAFSARMLPPHVQDIDSADVENPQLVSDYVNDVYRYMWELENRYKINHQYLKNQNEINGRMRAVLVDWMIQVHLRFHLLQETLYLTVGILDSFLQVEKVKRCKLQLVGVAAMFIASKYEEMYAPEIGDFVYITDNAYSKREILRMEQIILRTLNFSLGRPLPLHFLRRNSKAGNVDATVHTLAKYLMELTLPDYDLVHYVPSQIAAAALYLSVKLLDNAVWTETMAYYSRYTEKEILPLVSQMSKLVLASDSSKLQAVRSKYASSKFMKISTIPELKSSLIKKFANNT